MQMHCFDCRKITKFEDLGEGDGPACTVCGCWQASEAQGAHEICLLATWHDLDEYKKVAAIAKAGGFDVPEIPNYFLEENNVSNPCEP